MFYFVRKCSIKVLDEWLRKGEHKGNSRSDGDSNDCQYQPLSQTYARFPDWGRTWTGCDLRDFTFNAVFAGTSLTDLPADHYDAVGCCLPRNDVLERHFVAAPKLGCGDFFMPFLPMPSRTLPALHPALTGSRHGGFCNHARVPKHQNLQKAHQGLGRWISTFRAVGS